MSCIAQNYGITCRRPRHRVQLRLSTTVTHARRPTIRIQCLRRRDPWAEPFLRWTGSKRALVHRLLPLVSPGRYVEPFAGSACLFFAARPASAVLADNNADLIETFRQVKAHPRKLARALKSLPDTAETYDGLRQLVSADLSAFDRATRFIYLNRYCFNGVYRTDRFGKFNVPRGERQGSVPSEAALYRCSVALRNAVLASDDFEGVCRQARRGDFFYLDPPYSRAARPHYGLYGPDAFMRKDEPRLERALATIDRKGARFILSYSSPTGEGWLDERWHRIDVSVRRQVAASVDARRAATESLYSNTPFSVAA